MVANNKYSTDVLDSYVRRNSGALYDIMAGNNEDNVTGKLSSASPDNECAQMSISGGIDGDIADNFNVVDIHTQIIARQQEI